MFGLFLKTLKDEIEYCEVPKENVIYLNNETSYKKITFLRIIWLSF